MAFCSITLAFCSKISFAFQQKFLIGSFIFAVGLDCFGINHHCFRDLVAVPFCHGSEIFLCILAGAIFAEAIFDSSFFSDLLCIVVCSLRASALLFAAFVQLAWTVCDGSFDNHFASAQLLILQSAVANLVGGIRCILFCF